MGYYPSKKKLRELHSELSDEQFEAHWEETKAQLAREAESAKWQRQQRKEEREAAKVARFNNAREIKVLQFMLKSGVEYHHHSQVDDLKGEVEKQLQYIKLNGKFKTTDDWGEPIVVHHDVSQKYDSYIWNIQGPGNNTMPRCQLGRIFSSNEFATIYDVPLDGSYKFVTFDSGQRGLGGFDYMLAKKVETEFKAPEVNPGAIIPKVVYSK